MRSSSFIRSLVKRRGRSLDATRGSMSPAFLNSDSFRARKYIAHDYSSIVNLHFGDSAVVVSLYYFFGFSCAV